jgi:hypothetical protein
MSSVHKFRSLAAAVTLALAPVASFGVSSYDINRNITVGPPLDGSTGDVLPEGLGDSVLYPFYTTYNGATTTFSLTNTSFTDTIVVKVRFRDADQSRDELDFLVVLSPEDKFDFFVQEVGGTKRAAWNDNSCVIGFGGVPDPDFEGLKTLNFPVDYGNTTGHVEVIGMLNLQGLEDGTGGDLDQWAKHVTSSTGQAYPDNCGALRRTFGSREGVNGIAEEGGAPVLSNDSTAGQQALADADVPNVLTGSMFVTVPGMGIEAGTDAVMVRNTFERGFLAAQSRELCEGDPTSLTTGFVDQGTNACWAIMGDVTGQDDVDDQEFDHPNLRDINWVGANGEAGTNTVAVLDELMTAQEVLGDWTQNPATRAGADWVIPLITKYVYLNTAGDLCNAGDKLVGYNAPGACTAVPTPFEDENLGIANIPTLCGPSGGVPLTPVHVRGYDEETDTIESPGQDNPYVACDEVNVYTIAIAEEDGSAPTDLVQPYIDGNRTIILADESLNTPQGPQVVRGFAAATMTWNNEAPPTHENWDQLPGAAIAPLLWTIRATAAPSENNGSFRDLVRNNNLDRVLP